MDPDPAARERYARQLLLPELGPAGQARLAEARVLVVGAGGLGSAALGYLAAAGVGTLGLLDGDRVELSNLNRQLLHATPDLGRLKVESAREKLAALNPATRLELHPEDLTATNARARVREYALILDCTDNFPTRYRLNDACVRERRPLVVAAVHGWLGQLFTLLPAGWRPPGAPELPVPPGAGAGGCWRCLQPEPPPPHDGAILGATAGALGALQAAEALKLLAGCGEPLADRLLVVELGPMQFRTVDRPRDPGCPLCGDRPRPAE